MTVLPAALVVALALGVPTPKRVAKVDLSGLVKAITTATDSMAIPADVDVHCFANDYTDCVWIRLTDMPRKTTESGVMNGRVCTWHVEGLSDADTQKLIVGVVNKMLRSILDAREKDLP